MTTKQVNLRQLLNCTSFYLCSSMDDIYDVLNFMSADNLYTHQLPRVAEEVRPYLIEQHPFLEEASAKLRRDWEAHKAAGTSTQEIFYGLLDALDAEYGTEFTIFPMHFEDHEVIDPIDEIKRIKPDMKIIEFQVGEEDPEPPEGRIDWKVDKS